MIPVKAIEKAIIKNRGNLSAVARSFDRPRSTIANRVAKSDTLKKAMQQAREAQTDQAENILGEMIDEKHPAAVIFYLKTQGRNRGYIERHEISGPEGEAIPVKIIKGVSLDDL